MAVACRTASADVSLRVECLMTNRIAKFLLVGSCLAVCAAPAVAGPSVAAGIQHTVVLTDTGVVWTWGANTYGQLGDGTSTGRAVPTPVTAITGVTAIAAG